MVSPSCWTLMVSPRAHRLHSSSRFDLSSQVRDLVESAAEPNPGVVAIEGRLCLLDACSRLVVLVDVRTGAVPGLLEVFDGALAADLGGSELVASGPSPAPARRVEAASVRRCAATAPDRRVAWRRRVAHEPARSLPRYGRGRVAPRLPRPRVEPAQPQLSVAACSATVDARVRRSCEEWFEPLGDDTAPVAADGCRHASAGCWWASARR